MDKLKDAVLVLALLLLDGLLYSHGQVRRDRDQWKAKTAEAYHRLDRALEKPFPIGEFESQFIVDQADRAADYIGHLELELTTLKAEHEALLERHQEVSNELAMRKFVIR